MVGTVPRLVDLHRLAVPGLRLLKTSGVGSKGSEFREVEGDPRVPIAEMLSVPRECLTVEGLGDFGVPRPALLDGQGGELVSAIFGDGEFGQRFQNGDGLFK